MQKNMNTILRIYHGANLTDTELGDVSSITVGSGKKDTVSLSDLGLGKNHVSFTRADQGWQWKTANAVQFHGKQTSCGTMEAGESLLLDREKRLAVTVFYLYGLSRRKEFE